MPERTYTVGPRRVFDREPGTTLTADLDPAQEARLLASGALKLTGEAPAAEEHATTSNLSPATLEELRAMPLAELKELAEEYGVKDAKGLKSTQAVIDAIAARQGGSTEGASQHG